MWIFIKAKLSIFDKAYIFNTAYKYATYRQYFDTVRAIENIAKVLVCLDLTED